MKAKRYYVKELSLKRNSHAAMISMAQEKASRNDGLTKNFHSLFLENLRNLLLTQLNSLHLKNKLLSNYYRKRIELEDLLKTVIRFLS